MMLIFPAVAAKIVLCPNFVTDYAKSPARSRAGEAGRGSIPPGLASGVRGMTQGAAREEARVGGERAADLEHRGGT